ncbi:extracellular solute-binding protein [Entomospira entomophila]|uniref:Extracellular solute-binding protein n=1 Tax=Entomospira entomophila TaxID=2719988 RepID=A0A968G7R2_9SPIO|nr:extracellular solute-binding protein [Entomospira entomophilus]NIZ40128.1 extracellular solute-binding protein [Entomospira entomophilus]WDI35687.1 extracellular solute-binding protein [Entomospira entomophilus]
MMKKRVLIGLIATLGALSSCGAGKDRQVVNLFNWTYFIPDQVLYDFRNETGIHVQLDTYDGNDTMYAKLLSGNANYDVVVPSGDFVSLMIEQNMLQPLHKELLPNFRHFDPMILTYITFDPGNVYSVPYALGATGININTGKVSEFEASWRIFEREDLARRMTLMNDTRDVIGGALKYLGYSANSTNPDEINQARDHIIRYWKPNILKFDAEMFGKDFATGNTWIAQGFPEVVMKELEGSEAFKNHHFALPKEGGLIYLDNMAILADAPHPDLAHQLINYILRLDVHAFIMDEFWYPTLMPEAEALRRVAVPYSIEGLFANNYEFRENVGDAVTYYTQAWNVIMQSK